MEQAPPPPRRFRRRLLAVMLGCAVVPVLAVGLAVERGAEQALSLTLEPLDALFERAQPLAHAQDAALEQELRAARLNLVQAELARRALARRLPALLLGALLLSALLVAAAAALLGRALSSPVERLAEGMARVGAGELARPLPESGTTPERADELELLVRQFNRMSAELLAQRERLKVSEGLAAWQSVARGLAHELKNPLTAMKLALARLGRLAEQAPAAEGAAGRLREATGLLADEIDVLLRMTEGFSQFAKLPAPEPRPLDLGLLVREACALWRPGAPVELVCEAPALETVGDPDQLRRLVGNLVKNAVEASTPGGGAIEVALAAEGARATLWVRDRGAGIPRPLEGAETLRALGSTKPHGSGLGLPIAHKIAHDHGGRLVLAPRAGGGTEARVELPLAPRKEAA